MIEEQRVPGLINYCIRFFSENEMIERAKEKPITRRIINLALAWIRW